jgi:carboxyl-terminal processing protease
VLLKIETYHVNDPDWNRVIHGGVDALEIAVGEPAFVDRFPQPVATNPLQLFSSQLHEFVEPRRIRSRHQARDAVAMAAHLSARHLSIPPPATIMEFTCAAISSLDGYSSYLTGDQLDEVFSQIEGNFVGLGIELKAEAQSLLIVNVIPGGPADMAGIEPNDRILEVGGKSMREISTDAAADMLKGPELSYAEIVIQRPDQTMRHFRIQRRRVEVPSVSDVKILDSLNGIAYMKLLSFQKTTSQDMDRALWALHRQGMRTLIVDVRGNPGGLLNASVEVADKFIQAGTIVSTRGRSIREDYDYQAHNVGTWRVPLLVLIDSDSASASEIFAGAIRDHRRGTVIGQRSYGKGSVQGIFPLSRYKSGVRLTTAKFFSPSGQPISQRGVTPDIVVSDSRHAVAKPLEGKIRQEVEHDAVLQTALEVARTNHHQVRRTN